MNAPGKILIVRLSSLGDILHTIPAFRLLRTAFPQAQIDWLVSTEMQFLLSSVEGIDEVIPSNLKALGKAPASLSEWRRFTTLLGRLRKTGYDLSLDFQGLLKTAALCRLSGAKTRIGFSKDLVRERPADWFYNRTVGPPATQLHVIELNQLLAQAAGAGSGSKTLDLHVPQKDAQFVRELLMREQLSDFIIINPGGGWITKTWQTSKYGRLATRIQEELHIPVVVTTGPGERTMYDEIAEHCVHKPHHMELTFLQLIPLYRKARLLVGGDTGPFHLASGLGTPVVGIFGPTQPLRNGPWRNDGEVVVHPLPCSFCYGRTCPTRNECMDISVAEVFDAVVRRLGR